jgi:hypothetical protein
MSSIQLDLTVHLLLSGHEARLALRTGLYLMGRVSLPLADSSTKHIQKYYRVNTRMHRLPSFYTPASVSATLLSGLLLTFIPPGTVHTTTERSVTQPTFFLARLI